MSVPKGVFPIFLASSILMSCTKPLDLPLDEENTQELVLSCFFTSDELEAHLTKFRSVLQPEIIPEEDAIIELWQRDQIVDTLSYQGNGSYLYTGPNLISGELYQLTVKTDYHEVQASAILPPAKVEIDHATYFFVESADGNEYIDIHLHFSDLGSQKNYYEFVILNPFYDELKDSTHLSYLHDIAIPDAVLNREGDLVYAPSSFVFSDELINGGPYEMQLRFEHSSVSSNRWIKGKYRNNQSEYYLIFRTVSEDYYRFRKSWFRHRYNQSTDNQFDNELQLLFGAEPFTLFSNVSNGFGIFAGYHEYVFPIREQ
ncbi:MAG: DUF4249 domain-containing protein [bacterium]|nr:DUF4249 domain-containing protein [bacterium]